MVNIDYDCPSTKKKLTEEGVFVQWYEIPVYNQRDCAFDSQCKNYVSIYLFYLILFIRVMNLLYYIYRKKKKLKTRIQMDVRTGKIFPHMGCAEGSPTDQLHGRSWINRPKALTFCLIKWHRSLTL